MTSEKACHTCFRPLNDKQVISLSCTHLLCDACFEKVCVNHTVVCSNCFQLTHFSLTPWGTLLSSPPCFSPVSRITAYGQAADIPQHEQEFISNTAGIKIQLLGGDQQSACKLANQFTFMKQTDMKVKIFDSRAKRPQPDRFVPKFYPNASETLPSVPDRIHGVITAAYKTNFIYVQIEDQEFTRFLDFKSTLQTTLSLSASTKCCAPSRSAACAVFLEKEWHRAIIEEVSNDVANVFLVDSGRTEGVLLSDLYDLPTKFLKFPCQALRCKLSSVPVKTTYYPEVLKMFHTLLRRRVTLSFERYTLSSVRGYDLPETVAVVSMFLEDENLDVNQELKTFRPGNAVQELSSPSSGLVAGTNLSQQSPISISQHLAFKTWIKPDPDVVFCKPSFRGVVTWVDDDGHFYIHDVEWTQELAGIGQQLNSTFMGTQRTHKDLNLHPGDAVVARYENDWRRATILAIKKESATAFFNDYGSVGEVSRHDIRTDIIFDSVPIRTVRCELYNVTSMDVAHGQPNNWPNWVILELRNRAQKRQFDVTIRYRAPLRVSLEIPNSDQDPFIDILVRDGLAKYINKRKKNI